jgi:hypothetical protein
MAVVSCFFSGRARSTSFLIELLVEISPSFPGARANIRLNRLISPTVGVSGSGFAVETSVFCVPVEVGIRGSDGGRSCVTVLVSEEGGIRAAEEFHRRFHGCIESAFVIGDVCLMDAAVGRPFESG